MGYTFKRLSDVSSVEAPAEDANVLIEEQGVIKKVSNFFRQTINKIAQVDTVDAPSESAYVLIEENGVIKRVSKDEIGGIKVPTANVGQTIVVKAVDENGKPIEWECIDNVSTQPDWEQNDINAPDFIKNRTHYDYTEPEVLFDGEVEWGRNWRNNAGKACDCVYDDSVQPGQTFSIKVDDVTYKTNELLDFGDDGWYSGMYDENGVEVGVFDGFRVSVDFIPTSNHVTVARINRVIKQIDEKFIPDSIVPLYKVIKVNDEDNTVISVSSGIYEALQNMENGNHRLTLVNFVRYHETYGTKVEIITLFQRDSDYYWTWVSGQSFKLEVHPNDVVEYYYDD